MNLISNIRIFFKEVYVELRRVNWLSSKEVLRHTIIIVAVIIIVSAFLGGLDYFFAELLKRFLVK